VSAPGRSAAGHRGHDRARGPGAPGVLAGSPARRGRAEFGANTVPADQRPPSQTIAPAKDAKKARY